MVGVSIIGIFMFIYFFLAVVSAIYVYTDAKKRGMNAVMWALIALFVPFLLGLIIYLIFRKPLMEFQCPKCGNGLETHAKICPQCGHSLVTQCPECNFPVQRGWKSCPQCGNELPTNFEQPVRTYQKDSSGFIVIGVIVGIIVLTIVVILITYGANSISGNYHSESYVGLEGMYNITKDDLSGNSTIQTWIEESDASEETVHVLLSKSSNTCLIYVKHSEGLLSSNMELEYINDEKCSAIIFIDETEYEDLYGYDFFLYEFEVWDETEVDICLNVDDTEERITFTDADISIGTWGGN